MVLSSRNLSGIVVRKIRALTNDPMHPSESLVCQGRVLVPAKLSKKFVRFPAARMSDPTQTQTVTIERGDGGPLDLKVISPNVAGAEASLRVLEPGERYELILTMSPPRPANKKRILWKLATGVPESPRISLSAYLTVTPRVKAVPPKITLPNPVTSNTQQRVRLLWDGQPAGKILGASVRDQDLSVSVEQDKGGDVIVLDIPAGYELSRAGLAVVVSTDDATMPRVRIPIFAGRRPSANRSVRPAAAAVKPRPNVRRAVPRGSGGQ